MSILDGGRLAALFRHLRFRQGSQRHRSEHTPGLCPPFSSRVFRVLRSTGVLNSPFTAHVALAFFIAPVGSRRFTAVTSSARGVSLLFVVDSLRLSRGPIRFQKAQDHGVAPVDGRRNRTARPFQPAPSSSEPSSSPHLHRCLTPACSGLAPLAADARR